MSCVCLHIHKHVYLNIYYLWKGLLEHDPPTQATVAFDRLPKTCPIPSPKLVVLLSG